MWSSVLFVLLFLHVVVVGVGVDDDVSAAAAVSCCCFMACVSANPGSHVPSESWDVSAC